NGEEPIRHRDEGEACALAGLVRAAKRQPHRMCIVETIFADCINQDDLAPMLGGFFDEASQRIALATTRRAENCAMPSEKTLRSGAYPHASLRRNPTEVEIDAVVDIAASRSSCHPLQQTWRCGEHFVTEA